MTLDLPQPLGANDADELSGDRDTGGIDERFETGEIDLREAQVLLLW